MLRGVLISALQLPLLFRGDAMNQSGLAVLTFTTAPLVVFLAIKVRSGMPVRIASLWAILGIYASWAAGLLFGEPRAFAGDPYLLDGLGRWINLVPFATIATQVQGGSGSALVQLVGNVGLLLPLGLAGPILMPSLRRVRRLLLVALAGTTAIELVQLVATSVRFIDRSVDIDDVLLNVAGALLGWLLWRVVASLRVRVLRSIHVDGSLSLASTVEQKHPTDSASLL